MMLNDRLLALKERMLRAEHASARMMLPKDWNTCEMPVSLPERKAYALRLVVERMPLVVLEGELLVGSKTVFGPYPSDPTLVDPEKHKLGMNCYPKYTTPQERERFGDPEGKLDGYSKGHITPNYRRTLEYGLDGLRREIDERLTDASLSEGRVNFLKSARIALDAVTLMADRYAAHLLSLAKAAAPARRAELEEMARVCAKVAHEKPDTLHEAMQLYLFEYFSLLIEHGCSVGFGRVDQLFRPYMDGVGEEAAQALVGCLLLKMNDIADIDLVDMQYNGNDSIILGGILPDGTDGTNRLTYLVLDMIRALHIAAPMPAIRLHQGSPEALLLSALALNQAGINSLALYNDDAIIPALCGQGVPVEAARGWGLDLCQDILIEGASDMFCSLTLYYTDILFQVLEQADDTTTFEEMLAIWKRDTAEAIDRALVHAAEWERCACAYVDDQDSFTRARAKGTLGAHPPHCSLPGMYHMLSPAPLLSAFMDGCVENACDVINGGQRYRYRGCMVLTPINAVNSMVAIRHCVFDKGELTISQIKAAIACNYEGMENVRLALLEAPKWGNDDDACDLLAKDLMEFALREINRHHLHDGLPFMAGPHQPHTQAAGKNIRATPDGRRDYEPVPVTISPTNGTERNGPTAVLNSAAKLDPLLIQWNCALTLTLSANSTADDEGMARLAALVQGYFDQGGVQLQPNILDKNVLLDAQAHPENHRDLIVRVWGVSMYFVGLSKDWQDEIIARTEHGV